MQPVAVATLRQLSLEADAGGQGWDPAVRKALRRRARRAHRRHAGEAERGTVFTVRRHSCVAGVRPSGSELVVSQGEGSVPSLPLLAGCDSRGVPPARRDSRGALAAGRGSRGARRALCRATGASRTCGARTRRRRPSRRRPRARARATAAPPRRASPTSCTTRCPAAATLQAAGYLKSRLCSRPSYAQVTRALRRGPAACTFWRDWRDGRLLGTGWLTGGHLAGTAARLRRLLAHAAHHVGLRPAARRRRHCREPADGRRQALHEQARAPAGPPVLRRAGRRGQARSAAAAVLDSRARADLVRNVQTSFSNVLSRFEAGRTWRS